MPKAREERGEEGGRSLDGHLVVQDYSRGEKHVKQQVEVGQHDLLIDHRVWPVHDPALTNPPQDTGFAAPHQQNRLSLLSVGAILGASAPSNPPRIYKTPPQGHRESKAAPIGLPGKCEFPRR